MQMAARYYSISEFKDQKTPNILNRTARGKKKKIAAFRRGATALINTPRCAAGRMSLARRVRFSLSQLDSRVMQAPAQKERGKKVRCRGNCLPGAAHAWKERARVGYSVCCVRGARASNERGKNFLSAAGAQKSCIGFGFMVIPRDTSG